ncbi:MAG TPA: JAB domain-containing protein [Bacteroidales bacterium]|nr:JAB domain-containing protein [Bacteroidales bacterium]HRZ21323.1 JAB domain-containing protein [Bacteroidales bacterium]
MSNIKVVNPIISNSLKEIDIYYRNPLLLKETPKISNSADAVKYLRMVWGNRMDHVEEFLVLCLNRANHVLGYSRISRGGIAGTVADPKVIFQIALKANATSLILSHNHPSGNPEPSESDKALTKKLVDAGKVLEIHVLDHVIMTSESYFSFADEGILPSG